MAEPAAHDDVAELILTTTDTLCGASTLEEVMERYLEIVAAALPARSLGIYLFPTVHSRSGARITAGVSDVFLARYEDAGRDHDPVLDRALSTGRAVHSAHLMPDDDWQQLDFYKQVLALHRMRMVLEAPVTAGARAVGTLNFGDRDPARFAEPATLAVVSALGRVVGSAVSALNERGELQRERDHAYAALDVASDALVITDLASGRRRLNESARRLLETVAPADPEVWLEDTMAAAAAPGGDGRWTTMSESGWSLSVREVPGPPGSRTSITVLRLHEVASATAALPPSLAALLSPREQEVARLVALGLQDDQIAARVFLSRHTVKQHLKAIYRKLRINSRVALTRVVLDAPVPPPSHEG
ncbi:GAF domain-containing protein [Pseudonocardia ammonioxydans]|uniref:GAF domain-containing protein n=1 Tax=Pseudonocardia ammonioxydans TaxID=260086 RepID=A0A1I5FMV2_PSUAM|nr:LuxR C-terminal-related transcriptional regulator [Pseudonocardia ammonioxydans]SFO24956.1 GAF domain-containing protein [Pseudonocardia ammonioxydans]